ncbi:MAG TPA: excinuclease ABC subunit UvrC [Kiritimatiellia bacterium]|nr:excinuclease ABC subunit UvrC [Kiritimatiellia bacterium]
MTTSRVREKLKELPDKPGVYLMRDRSGKIIYVGKAVSLRNRVRSYFQEGTLRKAPPKLRGLIRSIEDFDFIVVRSDADAVVTEGRLIKEYKPRYNVSFRDDKRFLLVRVRLTDPFPRFQVCRLRKEDGAVYLGPYANSGAARVALEFVEKRFGLRVCSPRIPGEEDYKHCHNDVIRRCSAPCVGRISPEAYRARVEEAMAFLRGERKELLAELEGEMRKAAEERRFEDAAGLRDTLHLLRSAIRERSRGLRDLELVAEEARQGVEDLRDALGLAKRPEVIECFDVSNISGTHAVASMVCAVEGMPNRTRYRRFQIKTVEGIDDPRMMGEAVGRRYRRLKEEGGVMPDLILIDGGPTQLGAAREALEDLGLGEVPSAGLAKQFEEVYTRADYSGAPVRLARDSAGLKVLQRIRDEAHRFALTYHRLLRQRRIRESVLDEVEGIGEKRKEAILKHFGSVLRLRRATVDEIAEVPGVGRVMAEEIYGQLRKL